MGSYEKGGTEEDGAGLVSEYLGPGWSLVLAPISPPCGNGSVLGGGGPSTFMVFWDHTAQEKLSVISGVDGQRERSLRFCFKSLEITYSAMSPCKFPPGE